MLVLITHLGMGDAVLQAGLAVTLANLRGPIAFPAYPRYLESVRSFFVDQRGDIIVYPVPHQPGFDWGSPPDWAFEQAIREAGLQKADRMKLGVYSGRGLQTDFSKSFYDDARVAYDQRWDACPIAAAAGKVEQIEWEDPVARNIFVHDDPSRGFHISRIDQSTAYKPVMSPDQSILRYVRLLETAAVVCVIDSAFLHLAESLQLSGEAQLHCYPRWPRPREFRFPSRNKWTYIF